MNYQLPRIAEDILGRLDRELDRALVYHDASHTRKVIADSLALAEAEGLGERDLELLTIAAAFHDAGFLTQNDDNEPLGAEAATESMRAAGTYSEAETQLVAQAILETKRETKPTSKVSACLVDGDVANFGREDCFDKMELVWREQGTPSLRAFLTSVVALMSEHRWYTATAQKLWGESKQRNLEEMRRRAGSAGE